VVVLAPGGGGRVGTAPVGGGNRVGLPGPAGHRLAGQVGAAQFGSAGQAVMGGQDDHAGFGQEQLGVQTAAVERGAHHRDVGGATADRGGRSAGVAEQDVHLGHAWIPGAPLHDLLDQAGARAGFDREGEAAGLSPRPAGPLDRGGRCFDRDPALIEQDGAGRG
jgi:hypothetical protein